MPHKDPEARKAYAREYGLKRLALLKSGDPSQAKWAEQRRAGTLRSHYKHRDERLAKRKQYREENPEIIRAQKRAYYEANKASVAARKREWVEKNRSYVQEGRRKRYAEDVEFRIAYQLRNRLGRAVARGYKTGSAVRDLGCSIPHLIKHLEDQFTEGMSWDNWGEWHIDHIIPLVQFDLSNRDDLLRACHYTNLQPLWAKDNLSKGGRIAKTANIAYTKSAPQQEHRPIEAGPHRSMTINVMEPVNGNKREHRQP